MAEFEPKSWIIVDLDGTVCNIDHRKDFAVNKEWDEFHSRGVHDMPHPHVVDLIRREMNSGMNLLAVTGRPETWRTKTLAWMKEHDALLFEDLLMRPNKSFDPAGIVKVQLIDEFFGGHDQALEAVAYCLDDQDKIVKVLRDAGFKVHQVAEGDY